MQLWGRGAPAPEDVEGRRTHAAITLQRWTRGIKWRKTHAKDVRALAALRRFQQSTRAREQSLVEVTPLRRSAGLVASAMGAAAGYALGDASIGAATAAGVAAYSNRQGENERHKQTQQLTASLQKDAIDQDRHLHRDALRADLELHRKSIHVDKVLHLKTILTDLLEHDKEADRDLWEQRTERFSTLMTVSGLLFAGAFALAVEGDLPREARDDCAIRATTPRRDCLKLVTLHYSLLASAFGLHLCVISGCLCITRLFGEFMDVRLKGQAVIKRKMKRYSVLLLGMHENSLDSHDVAEAERKLDDALRQQCVIETSRRGTTDGGEATFAWSLFEWYERRCLLQEKVVNFCFQTGTLAIIGCLMTYMKAHLTLGDPEEMLVADTAFVAFASILGGFAVLSNLLSCLGATWWEGCCRASWWEGFTSWRRSGRPITYDTSVVVQRAEQLYTWADADANGTLDRNEFAEMIRSIDPVEGPSIRKVHDARLRDMAGAAGAARAAAGDSNGAEEPHKHPWDALDVQEDGTVYKRVLRTVVKRLMKRHDLSRGDSVSKFEWDGAVNEVTFSG